MQNPFKQALAAGQPQVGLWLSLANPYTTEICATAGFDWLLIDGEHSPNDLRSMLAQLQAVAPYRSEPVIRVVTGEPWMIKQALDIGARNLLVPMVDTVEQARALVSATRYPPEGIRGVGASAARVSRWGTVPGYLQNANESIGLLLQAETVEALGNLDAICAVDGVDGVFIGPADLSASMGQRGNAGHPEVQQAIEQAIATIRGHGKAAGILTPDTTLAQRYLTLGATFVAVGLDALVLRDGVKRLADQFGVGVGGSTGKEPSNLRG